MDDLNKHQIILLCILISFVVSIATGIMTTSLLMQAPVELTKTVNQVVEKTIETVTPAAVTGTNTGKQTTTVVVNEDDSVTSSIAKNTPSIVRIREQNADGSVDNLYSLGVIISSDGIVVADKQYISPVMNYVALTSDGVTIPLVAIAGDKKWQVSFFKAKPVKPYTFTPATLDVNDAQLGQTIISIGGDSSNAVAVGRVAYLTMKETAASSTTPATKSVSSVEGDVSPIDAVSGAPILSLSGNVIGISLSEFASTKSYLPSAIIKQDLQSIQVAK